MAFYLGLDVGTQGTKGLVIDDEAGVIVARASSAYGLIDGLPPGAAEQHPGAWMAAIAAVVRDLARGVDVARIAGVAVSGQQHGFVPLDARHEVIRPAKLWCDTTTAPEARELAAACGHPMPTGFTASKILWLKRHEPASWRRLRHVALPHDYVNFRLTGRLTTEAGDASGTGFFDAHARAFSPADVQAIDPALAAMLPPLVPPAEPAGVVSADASRELGLPAGIPVAAGGGDNMMSAIGSGATVPGVVVMSLGTSGTVFTYSPVPIVDPAGLIAPFCDSTGAWLPLLCVMNLTAVAEEVREAFSLDHATITRAAERTAPGAYGLQLFPFLQGERVPDLPQAAGSLLGLRPGWLEPGRLYRAALEGTTLNLAGGVARMEALGLVVDSLRLVGGAARNPLWRRIIAAVFGVPVSVMAETESAALGAAIQAVCTCRRAAGDAVAITEVARPFVQPEGPPITADPDERRRYAELRTGWERALADTYGVEPPPFPRHLRRRRGSR